MTGSSTMAAGAAGPPAGEEHVVEHTYRVLVRGRFTDLDDAGRARLLAAVDRHDALTNGFTAEGALTYDRSLDFFSFRVELRAEVGPDERAVERHGVDFRDLRASVTDVDLIKVRRPKR
ncbi:DUF6204 family protein [Saccharothrix lopnurensis]|uniref:DUF6204 family protein n=1 Tax=Saccharothrix lopnurensis TaxID=1670621 RepID=A0ABW1NXS1_9PSEU